MGKKKKATAVAPLNLNVTKVHNPTDLTKVLDYFRYTVGTTLDCAHATNIPRNCITWYVSDLERLGLLQAIYVAKDRRTHFMAKHYSADPQKWASKPDAQLSLFGEGGATWV